ncbi:Predicted N-acetyltransferase YhbS [Terribacillus saccharophilus]|uniref:Predicted N-acetyltransferase YhbS n=1 Tax=Terribacillus saccharophilus TaxID=361277 RepID=A0AAX2EEV7_9BACI|nr:GNAT family N-acetyltransferase [Terribacillus saccharophilus]SEN20141.1 Predicted N-acetyltransferase YhbS [Terribacillus saccharophilus]
MEIREMNHGEIEAVRQLRLKSYIEYKKLVSKEHWEVLERTLISENDLKSDVKIYVAEMDNVIVGSVVLFPASVRAYDWSDSVQEYPEIRLLSVNPDIRGKGIGAALVDHCLEVSKKGNEQHIGLHTASFMEKALLLYEKKGFVRLPEKDLEPMNDGIVVKGFIMDLKNS